MRSNDSIFDHGTILYGWAETPRQFPDTLPDGRIFVSQEIVGIDTINYYKWLPLPEIKPVFNSYTTFDSLTSHYVKMPVSAPKYHTEIYMHAATPQLAWEHNASAWSYCGLSLSFAIWLGCISAKLFRLSV